MALSVIAVLVTVPRFGFDCHICHIWYRFALQTPIYGHNSRKSIAITRMVSNDLEQWIIEYAPASCIIHVIVMAFHRGGQWYASNRIKQTANGAGKNVVVHWWRCVEIEDRKSCINISDVLRPTLIPEDPGIQQYAHMLSG